MAESVGAQRALDIYKELCKHTERICSNIPVNTQVWYSEFIEKEDEWARAKYSKYLQVGDSLGERITYAFTTGFEQADKLIIIGTDCPQLTSEHITSAFNALDFVDVVIGPALDGGYYLIGMNSMYAELFEKISWSSDKVLHQTLQSIGKLNLSFKIMEILSDVDHFQDWQKYGWEFGQKPN